MELTQGEIIKNARKEIGMAAKDLAAKIGVTPSAISQWENNASGIIDYRVLQLNQILPFKLFDFYNAPGPSTRTKPLCELERLEHWKINPEHKAANQDSKAIFSDFIHYFDQLSNDKKTAFLIFLLRSLSKGQRKALLAVILSEWLDL